MARKSVGMYAKKWITKRLPILQWLPKYNRGYLIADLIAGITVGLTAVPQSMAYATVAGLSPEYGLHSAFIGSFLYVIFGSCAQMTIFPTALSSLLAFQMCGDDYPQCIALASFYVGIFQIIMACLNFGIVVSLISQPVTMGFTAGAALTVATSQIKNLLGLSGRKGDGFIDTWKTIVDNISTIKVGDSVIGILSIFALIGLQKVKDLKVPVTSNWGMWFKKLLWYVSVGRNAIIVVATAIIAFSWAGGSPPFILTGDVEGGFPTVSIPQFELPSRDINDTISDTDKLSFWKTWGELKQGPAVLAAVSVLSNVAIAKAFGNGKSVDGTQEMFALGVIQTVGSFIGSIPSAGSFSRSAINEASGVKTTFGGVFSGLLVLFSLEFLTPSFYYIPKASLAAVIICAVVSLVEYEALPAMWKISKLDVVSCVATCVFSALLGLEYGIIVGIGVSVALLLIQSVRPRLPIEMKTMEGVEYYILKPEDRLNFPSVDFVQDSINNLVSKNISCKIIVLDLGNLIFLDYTAANALSALVKGLKKAGVTLVFLGIKPEDFTALETAGLTDPPCCDCEDDLIDYLKLAAKPVLKDTDKLSERSYVNLGSELGN